MLAMMLFLVLSGLTLLLAGPFLARRIVREGDPTGMARVLQAVGIALLLAALLTRPHNPDNTAFPPPPDAPAR